MMHCSDTGEAWSSNDGIFESTTEEQIERARSASVEPHHGDGSKELYVQTQSWLLQIGLASDGSEAVTPVIPEPNQADQARIDEIVARAAQMKEDGAEKQWQEAGVEEDKKANETRKMSMPEQETESSPQVYHDPMKRKHLEDREIEREDELAWSENRNVQWSRKRRRDDCDEERSKTSISGKAVDKSLRPDKPAPGRIKEPVRSRLTAKKPAVGVGNQTRTPKYLQVHAKPRILHRTALIDPDPDNVTLGQHFRLIQATPPPPQSWRTPGRIREQLKLTRNRIYTDYILADTFIDDINEMLLCIQNWPGDLAIEIMRSFKNDPINSGRKITFVEVIRECRYWILRIEDPNPSIYHPRLCENRHTLPLSQRPIGLNWDGEEYPELPQSCIEEGCESSCPQPRTREDKERSLHNGRKIQWNERMMEAKAKAQLETLKLADDRRKRTKAMPPPLCSVQTPSSPLLHPADARTSSVIPPALPAAPRPKQIELVLSNTERDHFRTVYGQESRRTTLSPTITPPPQSIPQAKYISTAEVTASKKRFYSKCLPPAATQVNPLTPKPEILPETTSRNDTPDFPRAQKRAKKSHRKLEAWQLDPARH